MNCPRCNVKVAFTKNQCDNCGQDLRDYRRIISISNSFYNRGLEQARVRDLSGAVSSLQQSLEYNKLNTNARNLLGLIYFEEGEVVSALSEWVLSRHYQPQNNDAEMYINEVQENPNRLEVYNQTIKKYNAALYAAQHGDEDMAVIQLKNVVNLNPKFIRANQLLALLYMMSGKREAKVRAKRLLTNISRVDVTNTTTIRYLKELSDIHLKGEEPQPPAKKETENRKVLPRVEADAYRQITPYQEEKPSIMPFVNVVIGIVIGLAVMGFLVIPHIRTGTADKENSDFKSYSETKATEESDFTTLQNENKELTAQVEELTAEIEELTGSGEDGTGTESVYETLLTAVQYYMEDDAVNAAKTLSKIDSSSLSGETTLALYETIQDATYEQASESYFLEGRDAYNGEGDYAGAVDYEKAIKLLNKALKYNADNTDAMYFLGRCYQQLSDTETAVEYYNQIIRDYPESSRVTEAQQHLRELGG